MEIPAHKTDNYKKYSLDFTVEKTINSQFNRLTDQNIGVITAYFIPRAVRDYIETSAVFYELMYPDVYPLKKEPAKKLDWKDFSVNEDFEVKQVHEAVMCRIIERGGKRVGPRRGYLYAKEKDIDINIPVRYCLDYDDAYLGDFLKPLFPKLDENLVFPMGYFDRTDEKMHNIIEVPLINVAKRLYLQTALKKMPECNLKKRILGSL